MLLLRPEEWWRLRAWQWEKQRRTERLFSKHRQRGFIINPFVFAAAGGDPYFANVISLAHWNGSNAFTGPYDDVVRGSGHWTNSGAGPQLATGVKQYGSASIDAGSVGVYSPDHADWDLGSGDFTIEGWVYLKAVTGPTGGAQNLFYKAASGYSPFLVYITATTTYPQFYSSNDGSSWGVAIAQTTLSIPINTAFSHLAATRSGNDYRFFIDGTQYGSTVTLSGAKMTNSNNVTIGGQDGGGGGLAMNGYVDDTRVTKGIARYTANFTPPASEFPDS